MFVINREDREIHEDRIENGDSLFIRINETFHSRFRKPVSVMENGKLCFNVIWESEYYCLGNFDNMDSKIGFFSNYYGELLTEEKEVLDLTFADQFDLFVFEGINEYSYHIIKLLNEIRPEKKIIVDDEYAGYFGDISFFKDGEYRNDLSAAGHFVSGHKLPEREGYYSVYSLMISMTWCRKRHYNENPEFDETVLVIDSSDPVSGFGDLIKIAGVYCILARRHHWIPVINMVKDCQYRDTPDEDCWSKFFENISEVNIKDLDKYKCWISVSENRKNDVISKANPYIYEELILRSSFDIDLKINEETLQIIKEKIPAPLWDKRILGVVIRTTDMEMLNKKNYDIDYYTEQVDDMFRNLRSGFDYIFLATEDEYVLNKFRQVFHEKLLYIDQHRVSPENRKNKMLVCDQISPMYESKYQLGCDYLSVIYALTGCEMILFNVFAGACFLAEIIKTRIKSGLRYTIIDYRIEQEIDNVICEVLENREKKVVIYGAGKNARVLISFYGLNGENTLLCDRKAEEGEYTVEGIPVISPDSLKKIYSDEYVIISPFSGKIQITQTLTGIGIPEEKIVNCNLRII